jgi:hypothetical protein
MTERRMVWLAILCGGNKKSPQKEEDTPKMTMIGPFEAHLRALSSAAGGIPLQAIGRRVAMKN